MTATLEANGLKLYNEKSYTKTGLEFPKDDSWKEVVKKYITKDCYFIAYLDYAVIIGTYRNKEFVFYNRDTNLIDKNFEPKFIQKIRLFNKESEFYMWKTGYVFKARVRTEVQLNNCDESKEIEYVQADQILFGTTSSDIRDGYTKLTEDRGTEVILPFSNIVVDNTDKRIAIRTRNYIGYNEIGQAGYVDCRFVCFVQMPSGEELI